jgi:hypothetical protein
MDGEEDGADGREPNEADDSEHPERDFKRSELQRRDRDVCTEVGCDYEKLASKGMQKKQASAHRKIITAIPIKSAAAAAAAKPVASPEIQSFRSPIGDKNER